MKKIVTLSLVFLCLYSCIKKDALKYDPELVGTWVGNQDSVNTWLTITADGQGDYATHGNSESPEIGEVRYSLWETKMFVGKKKFRVTQWLTGKTDGVDTLKTKVRETLNDTTYNIDMKMILKTTGLLEGRSMTLYRIK